MPVKRGKSRYVLTAPTSYFYRCCEVSLNFMRQCDESRPTCLNCTRHYTSASSCHYSRDPRSLQDGDVVLRPTKMLMRPMTLDSTNTLALRLMHHYTVSIGSTRSPEAHPKNMLARSMWEVEIPSIAFNSEVVLNALLGISAWHLWAVNPNDQKMKLVSRNYFGEAIRLQRAALEPPNTQQLKQAFIAGIILAHHCWLFSDTDGYSPELQLGTFYLCKGYRTLGKKLSPAWSEYACLGEVTPHKLRFEQTKCEKLMEEGIQDCNHILELTQNMDIDGKIKAAYCKVIGELLLMYGLVASDNNEVSVKEFVVVSFLHRVPLSFINLLQRREPLAMGLIARVWALLAPIHKVSSSWYIHGAGKFRVYTYAVANISNFMPGDWAWILNWPLRLISDYGA